MNERGQIDFGWNKPIKVKPIKIPKVKIAKLHVTKVGDRTLTPAQKRKAKEEAGFRCSVCHEKVDARYLEVHHKKSIASHKNKITGVDLPMYSMGKKIKPIYDAKSNLQVICIKCHDKTKKKKKKASSLYGMNYNSKSLFG